jgi:hypothetical protein
MLWIAVLGLAYRRRVTRSFWIRPLATLFFSVVVIAGVWHGTRTADATLLRFSPPVTLQAIVLDDWWRDGWQLLPARRNEVSSRDAWPLNVQYAGRMATLRAQLEAHGWQAESDAGWTGLLRSLDDDVGPDTLPVLPASHSGHADALVMTRPGLRDDLRLVLHLWPSTLAVAPGSLPVWQGSVAELRFDRRFRLLSLWRVTDRFAQARVQLQRSTPKLPQRTVQRGGEAVLLLREPG